MKRAVLWSILGMLVLAAAVYAADDTTWGRVKALLSLSALEDAEPAAKRGGQAKVDICHWDAEEEAFKLISVSIRSTPPHRT